MTNLITLTTDFGLSDGFVGVVKGVILSINPEAQCVDITHDIARQDIQQGALILANSVPYFPAAAIHLCIVDPGVGSSRRAIAVEVGEAIFVGPDNGVLSLAIEAHRVRVPAAKPCAVHLNNPGYWLPRVSTTFHGRDIFAPCAGHLSMRVPIEEIGAPIEDWVSLTHSLPTRRKDGSILGHVIYVDRYGNIVSDISEEDLQDLGTRNVSVEIAGREIEGLVKSYSDVAPEEFAALVGSAWKLEVAQREASAADALGVGVGDPVVVRPGLEE